MFVINLIEVRCSLLPTRALYSYEPIPEHGEDINDVEKVASDVSPRYPALDNTALPALVFKEL